MSERKNIDRLFQEKFKDFEVVPAEKVWENIEAELNKKKKRRVIPFWFRLSGVAAALLIGFFITNQFFFDGGQNEDQQQNNVVLENNNGTPATETTPGNNLNKPSEGIAVDNANPKMEANDDLDNDGLNDNNKLNVTAPKNANPAVQTKSSQAVTQTDKKQNTKTGLRQQTGIASSTEKDNIIEKEVHLKPVQKIAAAEQPKSEKTSSSNYRSQDLNGNNNNVASPNKDAIAGTDKNSTNKAAAKQVTEEQISGTGNPGLTNPDTKLSDKILKNQNGNSENNKSQIAETDIKKTDTTAIATVVPNALEELLHEKEQEKKQLTTAEPKLNRWQITSNVAPIYFSSASGGSPLDSRFESNKKTYVPTVAYGAGVRYAINKKLAVRSGINSVALEYKTTDLIFFQTPNARRIENVNSNMQGSLIQVDNTPIPLASTLGRASSPTVGRTIKQYNGSLTQRTGYIEVPVEMSYKLLEKKFGIEIIGGFSTLFLNQNEVSLVGEGLDMNIGEANNLSSLHFSTNLGLGVKYKFWKSFQAHMEPTLKYQINTYSSNDGNFKPYFFGLYTGLSYHF